jgi:hypothetical protein
VGKGRVKGCIKRCIPGCIKGCIKRCNKGACSGASLRDVLHSARQLMFVPRAPLPQPSHAPAPRTQRLPHQRDVDALFQPPPQRLVNVPREVGGRQHDDVLALLTLLAVAPIDLCGARGGADLGASGQVEVPVLPRCAVTAIARSRRRRRRRRRTCTSSSLFTRRDASCSPSAPRCVQSESISSMKMTEGAYARASSNRQRTCAVGGQRAAFGDR